MGEGLVPNRRSIWGTWVAEGTPVTEWADVVDA